MCVGGENLSTMASINISFITQEKHPSDLSDEQQTHEFLKLSYVFFHCKSFVSREEFPIRN